MNIPGVSTAPTTAPPIVSRVLPQEVSATAQAQTAAALLAQTTVDLSPLGRFLSAITLFQKRLLDLQANSGANPTETQAEEAVAAVATAVVAVADRANELQASALNGSADDQQLATLFGQQFAALTPGDNDDDSASLAAIGLSFAPPGERDGEVLNVDTDVLQAAFQNDPDGTLALLDQTANAFAALTGITAAASADPALLLDDEEAPFDPLTAAIPTPQDFPELEPLPLPVTTDDAFLQELLADTPRPVLAQAAPPSVAEAEANFAAQQISATDTDSAALPANPPQSAPPASLASATPATVQPQTAPAAVATTLIAPLQPATEATATLPASAPDANDTAASAAPPTQQAATITPAPLPQTASLPPATAQPDTGGAAERQIAAAQDATRDANARLADTISAEREANERIAAKAATQEADEAAQRERLAGEQATAERLSGQRFEQGRIDEVNEQKRLERVLDKGEPASAMQQTDTPGRRRVAAAAAQPAVAADAAAVAGLPPPPLQAVNNAQQLARDPATMAAIAAYNLGAGPFAALHGRPEMAAQRPKAIPAVESVGKVAAIEADASTSEFTRPSR
jgi:hypothetical protein